MVRIIITGACGKMGTAIIKCALEAKEFEIVGLLEAKGHPQAGKTLPAVPGVVIADDLEKIIDNCDAVIDFTEAKASLENFITATAHGKGHVIGTTGFGEAALARIMGDKKAKAVISPNMSIGMNILFDVAAKTAARLGDDYDVEIVEMHHRFKKDAPSGSALRIKDAVTSARPDKKWVDVYGRQGMIGERKTEEIGVMTLRGGDVVGEHTIFFVGMGERLEFTHRAFSRDNFARGALTAAKWLMTQPEGVYSMKDVLGL